MLLDAGQAPAAEAESFGGRDASPAVAHKRRFRKASGSCKWCKGPRSSRREGAVFCSDGCRKAFHNHAMRQGAEIIHIAKRWRRHRQKGDFALFTRMLDRLIADDRQADRDYHPDPPTSAYAKVVGRNIQGRRRAR